MVSEEAPKVKYAVSTTMLIIMLMAGVAAWAECPGTCPQPVQIQCPAPCPATETICPQPCVEPCPQPCPCPQPKACCPASIPAAVGAGPQGALVGLACPEFDPAYARVTYQQNATIIAVTEFGMQKASNGNLRDISREIHDRLMSANQKLAVAYQACGCLSADNARAQAIIAGLCDQSGECFDVAYAKTLSALVKQSQAANDMASTKAVNTQMQQQAQFMSTREADWGFRLDRWVTDHGYAA